MSKRLWPLELSAIMTFGVLAILTLSTGIAWKERVQLLAENERLKGTIAHPVQLNDHLGSVISPDASST
jgi:hypothetical protein